MTDPVVRWSEIADEYKYGGLLLGNGASIAFNGRFAYSSLKESAREAGLFNEDVERVFAHLETFDFELVLRMLWHASKINEALDVEDTRTSAAYSHVRDALIEIVHQVHIDHADVAERLVNAAEFMSSFRTVASLNYDLLVYWALMTGIRQTPGQFKDGFVDNCRFDDNWQRLRTALPGRPTPTIVCYPHGNLALAASIVGGECKVQTDDDGNLLGTIFDRWRSEEWAPVFVSEGTSQQKVRAIQRSHYLSTVSNEILPDMGDTVVFFGWSFGDNDEHLLDAVLSGVSSKFAVGVDPTSEGLVEQQATIQRKLRSRMRSRPFDLVYFDQWQDAWLNHPLEQSADEETA